MGKNPKSAPKKNQSNRRRNRNHSPTTSNRQPEDLLSFVAVLKQHRDGYGFAIPIPEENKSYDVFIPIHRLNGAFDGDRIRVGYWKEGGGERYEGRVDEILERGKRCLIGILKKNGKQYFVAVEAYRQSLNFLVDKSDLRGAKLGGTLGIEVVDFPEGKEPGKARVIQIFGERGDQQTEIDIVILKHQLAMDFPEAVLKEAQELKDKPQRISKKAREDLRKLPFVTIDGETARDFDDAILVKRERSGFRLWVSIADVSHYVVPGSILDQEALKRGTSVYFTDRVIPMLPEVLSNDLCSLRPHEDRLTFTAEIAFGKDGSVREQYFYKSVICSQARLTYNQVAKAIVDQDPEARQKIKASVPMLEDAFALFKVLRKKRSQRGSIDFDLPEQEFVVGLEDGNIESVVKSERNQAHILIEEFMVTANEAVATFIEQHKVPSLYRVHGQPDPGKIKNFQLFMHNLGFSVKLSEEPKPLELSLALEKVVGHAEEKLLRHLLLRAMKQAVYSPNNEGHYGLASPSYTHFTSPIRRYPDLVVHRVLDQVLSKTRSKSPKSDLEKLTAIAQHTSRRERVAMEAEWEAIDLQVALFMKKYVGEEFEGMVSRIAKFGCFVELKDFFVEGLVMVKDLQDDYYSFDEKNHRLIGRRTKKVLKIGSEIKIVVAKVDIEERRVYFVPVGQDRRV